MHLLSNATHYEKLHELGHFEHWSSKTLDGHFTDFADDAADIMGNAARSRGLTLNANIAGKQKGIDYHLDEHIPELIEKADKGLIEYWRSAQVPSPQATYLTPQLRGRVHSQMNRLQ